MKKILSIVLTLCLLFVYTGAYAETTLRFSWWGGDNRHVSYLAGIEAYEALNPDITIEGEYQAWDGYQTKLWTQLASGNQADIMQLDAPWFPELAAKGDIWVDLYDQNIFDLSYFDMAFTKGFGEFDGRLIGVPTGVNSNNLLINKTLADKLGIEISWLWEAPYTYDQFKEFAANLYTDHGIYAFSSDVGGTNGNWVRTRLKQLSGKQLFEMDYTIGFTEEQLVKCYEWVLELSKVNGSAPIAETQLYAGQIENSPAWVNSGVLICTDWSSAVGRYQATLPEGFEVVSARFPHDPDGIDMATQTVRPSMMIGLKKDGADVDAALKFLQWFFNDEDAAIVLGDTRGINSTSIQLEKNKAAGTLNQESAKIVNIGLENKLPDENALSTNTELSTILTDQLALVMYQESDPKDVAADTMLLLEAKLAEIKASA